MRRVGTAVAGVALPGILVALAAWSGTAGDHDGLKRPSSASAGVGGGSGHGQEPADYRIDPDDSWVVAVTEKAGVLGFLGHRHSVRVTDWTVEVDWRPEEPGASRATVTVPTRSLRIDGARGRELAGLGGGPSEDDVAELQEKLLAADNLAAAEHPEIRLRVTGVEARRGGDLEVEGRLTLRGRTRTVRFPVGVVKTRGGGTAFSGSFTVNQTDFGIEPESIAGVVKVADAVEVRFRLMVRR